MGLEVHRSRFQQVKCVSMRAALNQITEIEIWRFGNICSGYSEMDLILYLKDSIQNLVPCLCDSHHTWNLILRRHRLRYFGVEREDVGSILTSDIEPLEAVLVPK